MKLSSLHIDRFGARSDLDLADFTDQLNVVYGPNGSGKTTIIQFIRWMMFGDRDEMSRRYLTTSKGPAAGSMTVRDHSGHRTLERTCQPGSLLSQLTVKEGNGRESHGPLGISNAEFDRFFVVSFDRSRNIADLINSANLHGFQLHVDERLVEQAKLLRERIEQQRLELNRFAYVETQEQLIRLRDQRRREIDALRQEYLRRQQDLQQQRTHIGLELSDPTARVERLRSVVANIEQAIASRKRQLAEEHQQWAVARREIEERRGQRIADIDGQLNRWQDILSEVRSRLEDVRTRVASFTDANVAPADTKEVQYFMRSLGFQIRDIEQDLSGVYQTESWRDHETDADYMRGLLSSALRSMQNDVAQLGQSLERQQQVNELHETREELNYLCRVEKELADLVDALGRQRYQLGRHSNLATDRVWTGSISSDTVQEMSLYPSSNMDVEYRPSIDFDLEATHGLDDFRLRHLSDRLESARARLSQSELELSAIEQRLRNVDSELARLRNDAQSERLEREVAEIENKLRLREQRSSLERAIADLEDQWRRISEQNGTSRTVHRASELLEQLTEGEYSRIEVSGDHRCRVTGQNGASRISTLESISAPFAYDYSQLSRGVQDQVYLAIMLAIVESLQAKGSDAPLILNDVFGNLDQSGTRSLSRVLTSFAAQGHQVFVFTRHDHIRDIFQNTQARVFTLREHHPGSYKNFVPEPKRILRPEPIRPVYDSAIELTPPPSPSYKWVAEWQDRKNQPISPLPNRPVDDADATLLSMTDQNYVSLAGTDVEREVRQAESVLPKLALNSSLNDVTLLSDEFVGYMQRLNIRNVEDFLELDPEDAERELSDHGITADIVQRRQRELLMIIYVGTSVTDAQLLVACGVPDPARLARADEAVLLKRVETVLSRPQAADRFGTIDRYHLSRVRKWIESARNSRFSGRPRRTFRSQPFTRDASAGAASHRQSSMQASRRTSSARHSDANRESATLRMTQQSSSLRFYLEPQDQIVDAPSIGPKTAERLNAVDVYTVDDLLQADPNALADRLDTKRITPDVIQQWQLQAKLVCCIPNLRGHDAQILVACGVEDPVTLASLDASSFLSKVVRFVESKEGQRAIRNAKKPDLAEVTAWIEWAESARQLRAA